MVNVNDKCCSECAKKGKVVICEEIDDDEQSILLKCPVCKIEGWVFGDEF